MEQEMTCASSVFQMNAKMVYKCSTQLTGLKNEFQNEFYFRCRDQPFAAENERNTNQESYKFTIVGTQPLILSSVGPNGTMRDSTPEIKVTLTAKTLAGFNEGEAICEYSESCYIESGSKENFVDKFYNTGGYEHSQELWISEGDYECVIRCIDLGGNSDTKITSFKVEIDNTAPTIVRAYREDEYLKIITNEGSECVYGVDDCNYLFADGIKMNKLEDINHYTSWDSKKTLYIKCADEYGNRPIPENKCSLIVKPFEISYN